MLTSQHSAAPGARGRHALSVNSRAGSVVLLSPYKSAVRTFPIAFFRSSFSTRTVVHVAVWPIAEHVIVIIVTAIARAIRATATGTLSVVVCVFHAKFSQVV